MPDSPITLAVLVSGSGTTLQNLIDEIVAGRLNAKIAIVIGSRAGLLGSERAAKAGIRNVVVNRKEFANVADFSREVFRHVDAANADLVCLAGWLCLLDLPERYAHKAMNIHPALLPSFGGKGMYGAKVHEAVINHGCKVSGCTVHFLDNAYDSGPIILQRTCPVLDDDTPAVLAHRVFAEEKIAYPEAIRLFQQGRLHVEGRRVRITREPRPRTS
jgi:formyltetrahydrofolate-dependent phosphoribosylglycinamide formyltransferase